MHAAVGTSPCIRPAGYVWCGEASAVVSRWCPTFELDARSAQQRRRRPTLQVLPGADVGYPVLIRNGLLEVNGYLLTSSRCDRFTALPGAGNRLDLRANAATRTNRLDDGQHCVTRTCVDRIGQPSGLCRYKSRPQKGDQSSRSYIGFSL